MASWLHSRNYPSIPIESLIVISHPQTIVKSSHVPFDSKTIIHTANLVERMVAFESIYDTPLIPRRVLKKLSSEILRNHVSYQPHIVKQFRLTKEELLKGVYCPVCSSIPMKRMHGNWYCVSCEYLSKDAHVESLREYYLLVDSEITNRKAREFLLVPSSFTTKRLLFNLGLPYRGEKKGRVYALDSLI
ncbi:MAG TPA: hypothetical protein VEY51_15580 [Chondromyces sp.]|nr:hypothetical protein [Chondromyces sp.]